MIKGKGTSGICLLLLLTGLLTGCAGKENENIAQGMTLISESDYTGALECFEAAMVYHEDEELLYRGQGIAYMGLYQYEDAVESFLKSFTYADGKVTNLEYDTNYYLASAYYKLGKYEDAEKIYSAIIGLNSKAQDAYYLRGCTYLQEGYFDTALLDFEKAFALSDKPVDLVIDAYLEMEQSGYKQEGQTYLAAYMSANEKTLQSSQKGMLYYYLEDYVNARTYLDGALNLGDAEVSLILGKTYEELGTLDYATVVYQTYLDANAPDAAIYDSLGICLMEQEKYADALEAFQAGVDMGDSSYIQNLLFHRIIANEYLGNFEEAKNLMVEYLSIYPNDTTAARENQFLQTR